MVFSKLHIEWERWRWNEEYEIYVSTFGNFKDKDKKDIKPKVNESGYLTIYVNKFEKNFVAHRLVMITWKPILNAMEMTVDHVDHNKRNNRLKNLEWVTRQENEQRAINDTKNSELKFYFVVNGQHFTSPEEAFPYVKSKMDYLDAVLLRVEAIQKIYKTLTNAYLFKDKYYIANNFTKEKYNCKFTIIEKGA